MAWTSSPSTMIAGVPMFVGPNQAGVNDVACGWYETESFEGVNSTHIGDITESLVDSANNTVVRSSSSDSIQYLLFYFPEPGIAFDSVMISRLGYQDSIIDIEGGLDVSDSDIFGSPEPLWYGQFPWSTVGRSLFFGDLRTAGITSKFSGVEFASFSVGLNAQTFDFLHAGEVWFGNRYQWGRGPSRPYDPQPLNSSVSRFTTDTGVTFQYVVHEGLVSLDTTMQITDSETSARMEAFLLSIEYGNKPFLWVPEPSLNGDTLAPDVAHIMLLAGNTCEMKRTGWRKWEWQLHADEQPVGVVSQ
jgi:hypothetical protein